MLQTEDTVYSFDEFEVDTAKRLLLKRGQSVHLKSKAFDILLILIAHRGEILSKNALLDLAWQNQFVQENNLTVHIAALRKALGETKDDRRFIVTVPGGGYKFVGQLNGNTSGDLRRAGEKDPPCADAELEIKRNSLIHFLLVNRHIAVSILAAILLVAVGGSFYVRNRGRVKTVSGGRTFQSSTIKRLTTDGRSTNAALSPDGKLFVYSHVDGDLQSLWLGHVDGGEPKQLLSPSKVTFFSTKFSPDASNIYYAASDQNGERATYKIPVFGGVPEKILDDAYVIAFAPDGRRFAFVRKNPENKRTFLLTAESSGKDQIELAAAPEDTNFVSQSVAWSPDGTEIAVGLLSTNSEVGCDLLTINAADGSTMRLTSQKWGAIGASAWLADGNGLIVVAERQDSNHQQLWAVSYPDGSVQHEVNDLNMYGTVSLAGSQNALITIQVQALSNIWVAPAEDLGRSKQITTGSIGQREGGYGVAWTPDGRLVYTAEIDAKNTIWIMNSDGSDERQLIPSGGNNRSPSLTADSHRIVFESNRDGRFAVWTAYLDGSDLHKLTDVNIAAQPHASPDGRWIVYVSDLDESGELWRISTEGGEPVKLADEASWPRISPDSQFIACGFGRDGTKIAIFPITGGEPTKIFDLPRLANLRLGVRWTPDGKAVTYRDWADGIWRQNLVGGEPKQLKGLPHEKLYAYDWSRDGSRFAFTRGTEIRDVIFIGPSN